MTGRPRVPTLEPEYTVRVADLAVALGVTKRVVAIWCGQGRIPSIRVGKMWLIRCDWEAVLTARARDSVEERAHG